MGIHLVILQDDIFKPDANEFSAVLLFEKEKKCNAKTYSPAAAPAGRRAGTRRRWAATGPSGCRRRGRAGCRGTTRR